MTKTMCALGCIALLTGCVVGADHFGWNVGRVVLQPGPLGTFDSVAVKDPSIVRFGGRWHLFYTARDQTEYTLGYASAKSLDGLGSAQRFNLNQLHGVKSNYVAAPQVFYFRPQLKWYLIFQTRDSNYQPSYSTSTNIADPRSWTEARPLISKPQNVNWIDFWVLCDQQTAYLFFTRSHKEVVVMSTRLADFPSGFGEPHVVFAPVFEAVHVYRMQGGSSPEYVMLYEQRDASDVRHFGLAHATNPAGEWQIEDESFAAGERLASNPNGRWTDEVSHGELLRSGYDECLEIPRDRWDLLIQGMPREAHQGDYDVLPWKLGLIRARSR